MGERFYLQQLQKTGDCPGNRKLKGKSKMAWTDESKAKAVEMYQAGEPTPENSMELVVDIASELDESPNGVRMILTKAGVYIKKAAGATKSDSKSSGTRVSKADSQKALADAIKDAGQKVDEDVLSKLTGKAAQYFTAVITAVNA